MNPKKLLLAIGLFAAAALSVRADNVPLPYSTLPAGAPGTIGYSTNLSQGWTNATFTTNVTQYWTNAPGFGSMVTVTNYFTNNVLTYADADVSQQETFSLQSVIGVAGVTTVNATTNRQTTWARVGENGYVDNVNTWTWSAPGFGTTNWGTSTNFTSWIGGYKKVRLITDTWMGTNGLAMTNVALEVERKRTTPVLNSGR